MINSCPLKKGKVTSTKRCYGLSVFTKKVQNGNVFTKITIFEIELVVSTRPLQKEFYNNKRIDPSWQLNGFKASA